MGVVGRADPVLGHAPCPQKLLESGRPKLGPVIAREMLCHSKHTKVLLEALDEITAGSLPGVCHRQDLSTVLALGPVLFRCAHTKLAAGCFVKLSSH